MNPDDAFERILASLYQAMLDEAHWPETCALIDETCGVRGTALVVGERTGNASAERVHFLRYPAPEGVAGRRLPEGRGPEPSMGPGGPGGG